LDDDGKSVVDRVVLVQAVLFTDWTKQLTLLDYSTVLGVYNRCGCVGNVTEVIFIAVRFAQLKPAGSHWQERGGVTSAISRGR
jgi:hypothetical protein